ncbi:MAG TPA: radical SAM protein [Coriobacteriia bacterium]|jgi:radical SAM superfamily enzyme YgiQ (UPF0313 family)
MTARQHIPRVALIEAGSPGLNIYSHVAMGRGTAILATVVRDAGYEVRAFIEDVSGKGSVDWDWVAGADVVGFSAITCTLTRTAELVARARAAAPGAAIVLGGPEPTYATGRAFEAGADFVIRGEAELTFPAFLRALLLGDGDPHAIEGVCWSDGGSVCEGPPPRQLTKAEVQALPLVDNSLVAGIERRTTGLVWRSRGCPERCDFCEVCEMWPRYVLRDEEKSVEELMLCQAEGAPGVFLIDDNAAANKPSFKRFLSQAIERGYARLLVVQMRADAVFDSKGRIDRELLRLLKRVASTTMVCVGVESSADEDLEAVGKHIDSDRTAAALRAMRRYGLLVHGMFIAFAGDTRKTLRRNGGYARKYVTTLQYLFETPLPGTRRTARHERAGRVLYDKLADLKFLDGMHIALRPELMSAREMQESVLREYRRFYSWTRVQGAFVRGLLFRHRLLSPAQRAYLRNLRPWHRFKTWVWFHAEYKFAPWSLLRIGRRRVIEFLRDAEYAEYVARLEG